MVSRPVRHVRAAAASLNGAAYVATEGLPSVAQIAKSIARAPTFAHRSKDLGPCCRSEQPGRIEPCKTVSPRSCSGGGSPSTLTSLLRTPWLKSVRPFSPDGRADCRRTQDRPLPPWAWLNQAAHADVGRLREAAGRPADKTSRRGDDIQAVLARAVLAASAPDDLVRLQREVLVPLELHLMGAVLSPRRAVELVTAALFSPCHS